MSKPNLIITYLAAAGEGISGGTRIHIECTKRWLKTKKFKNITIIASDDGYRACLRNGLPANNLILVSTAITKKVGFWLDYFARIVKGALYALSYVLKPEEQYFVYAASDFWADFFPAVILKLRYKRKVKLLASLYLFAPVPWAHDNPYKGFYFIVGLLYWLTQIPVYWAIYYLADYVFVTSEPDVKSFITNKRNRSKIIVAQGGVDISDSEKYLKGRGIIPVWERTFDACFVGRFHHQKGVSELIDIWNDVCNKLPHAKLAMVGTGSGPMERTVRDKIKKYRLDRNIILFGFLDGHKKYSIFKNSKIVVHPATFDSGGMAAAEAMAWKIPGVSFDLESLKTYYPKGMMKTKLNDLNQFSQNILKLLQNRRLYNKVSKDAHDLIVEVWDWDKRSQVILNKFLKL